MTKHLPDEFWTELARRRRRHAMEIMLVCVAGLIPWTIYLALTLPGDYRAHYWRLSWAGFDVVLLVAMALTAYLGWRGRLTVIVGAVVTATLLICDAWFDVVLDLGTRGVWTSLGSAVFLELPLAAFFLRRAYLIMRLALVRAQDSVAMRVGVEIEEVERLARGREPGRELDGELDHALSRGLSRDFSRGLGRTLDRPLDRTLERGIERREPRDRVCR